ncbi:MAG: right-handed parallel beta-helix repeat-containing protein [Pyrinomonadaceae bacterium]
MNKTRSPRTIFLQLIRTFLLTASVLLLANLSVVQAQINNPAPACTKVAQPGPDLRAFLNTLIPGDVGCLRAGTYGARGTYAYWYPSGTPSAPITLMGYPGESMPVILGALYIEGNNLVLSRLLFDGPTGRLVTPTSSNPNGEVDQVSIYGDNVEVSHCEVRNNGYHAGIYLENAFNARLIGNYIHDNGRFGNLSSANMDHGIYFASGSGLIANNIVEHNWSFGVHIYPSASNVTVQQNTIIKNGKSGVIIGGQTTDCSSTTGCPPQPTNNIVVNNILALNGQHAIHSYELTTTGHIVRNNLFWQNAAGDIPSDERLRRGLTFQNNIQADPRFVGAFNYRLQFSSPAIDAALSPYTQRDDYDFIPRPQGTASDIGAFEFKLGTTAASVSVSGRVLSSRGRGVFNAVVHLTNQMGEIQTTRTNSSGYYTFQEVAAGESYIFNVYAKRYQFNPQVIALTADLDGLNFTAQ